MKTIIKAALVVGVSSLTTLSAPGFSLHLFVPAPPVPVVTVAVPAPAVTVSVGVPDSYFWDGYEYVGLVGGEYYYLGPDRLWLVCDPVRLDHFHHWESAHADWRAHAIVNVNYRKDTRGRKHSFHDASPAAKVGAGHDHGSGQGHDHDH